MITTNESGKIIASENCHWYAKSGEPCYEVPRSDGKGLRSTTLRDARKLGLVPSVTSIMQMLPKPALNIWHMKNVLMAALTLPRHSIESDEAYISRIMFDSQEQSRKAAEKGTEIHTAIENALRGRTIPLQYMCEVSATISEVGDFLKTDFVELCEPEKSFYHPLGFGGKTDLHSRELNFVCDFKTKVFNDPEKLEIYDEHKIQLSAYRRGLDMPEGTRLFNVFISTSTSGLVKIIEHDLVEEKHYWEIFKSLLNTWKLFKKYDC